MDINFRSITWLIVGVVILVCLFFGGRYFYKRIYEKWVIHQTKEWFQETEAEEKEFEREYIKMNPGSSSVHLLELYDQERKIKEFPPGSIDGFDEAKKVIRQQPEFAAKYLQDYMKISELLTKMQDKELTPYNTNQKNTLKLIEKLNYNTKQLVKKYPEYWQPIDLRISGFNVSLNYLLDNEKTEKFQEIYQSYENFVQKIEGRHPEIVEDKLWQYKKNEIKGLVSSDKEPDNKKIKVNGDTIEFEQEIDVDPDLLQEIIREADHNDHEKILQEYIRRSSDTGLQDLVN